MVNQIGSAKAALLVVLGVVGALIAVVAMSYISAYNVGNQFENKLKAEYENNQNILAQYSQKVMEAAQVPDMMRDDMVAVARAALEGRYGENGSRAVFQAIAEQNPQTSEALYIKLQQIIEAGRDEFKNAQTRLIDTRRAYETALGSFWQGLWLRIAGYPKEDLTKYRAVITDSVEQTFKAGKEASPIKLRSAQ